MLQQSLPLVIFIESGRRCNKNKSEDLPVSLPHSRLSGERRWSGFYRFHFITDLRELSYL